jgi:DNA-binding CsgD family transcriptional regulator
MAGSEVAALTPREAETLALVGGGFSEADIADNLGLEFAEARALIRLAERKARQLCRGAVDSEA